MHQTNSCNFSTRSTPAVSTYLHTFHLRSLRLLHDLFFFLELFSSHSTTNLLTQHCQQGWQDHKHPTLTIALVHLFCNPRLLPRMRNGCSAKRFHSFYAVHADQSHPPHVRPDHLTIAWRGKRAAFADAKPIFIPFSFSTPAKPGATANEHPHQAK